MLSELKPVGICPNGGWEEMECGIMTTSKSRQPDRPENGSDNGPLNRLVSSTDQAARVVAPLIKCAMCTNLELVSLTGRRARAYLDLPNVLAQCHGPQDLFAAQARFWQTALRDYTECTQRIVATLGAFDANESATDERNGPPRERDALTLPEVFSFAAWTLPESGPSRRPAQGRAA